MQFATLDHSVYVTIIENRGLLLIKLMPMNAISQTTTKHSSVKKDLLVRQASDFGRLRCLSVLSLSTLLLALLGSSGSKPGMAQVSAYGDFPEAAPPFYRVRYEASTESGQLVFPVSYTVWIPETRSGQLRGVIVHQHGCGEGSCRSGLTGAFDLHWQALASKHSCALLAAAYEQPQEADCQLWCDPRNGSDAAFRKSLEDLGVQSGHPELSKVPWALWGHSGGGVWAGGMTLMHPKRVAAAWLRSGVPLLEADPDRPSSKPFEVPEEALGVPIMCNLGTKEGVSVTDGRFAGVWPRNQAFFESLRTRGGLVGIAVDPITGHECGNQRYLAIRWLDSCLTDRLPQTLDQPLNPMPTEGQWLATIDSHRATAAAQYKDDPLRAIWLPNARLAQAWMDYVQDTEVTDTTPPPPPSNVRRQGQQLSWDASADLESGLAYFVIQRNGESFAEVAGLGKTRFGRPIFQGLQYSDTPEQPLARLRFQSSEFADDDAVFQVVTVNTVGLKSPPSAAASRGD